MTPPYLEHLKCCEACNYAWPCPMCDIGVVTENGHSCNCPRGTGEGHKLRTAYWAAAELPQSCR